MITIAIEHNTDIVETFPILDDSVIESLEDFVSEYEDVEILSKKVYQEYDITLRCENIDFISELQSFLEDNQYI